MSERREEGRVGTHTLKGLSETAVVEGEQDVALFLYIFKEDELTVPPPTCHYLSSEFEAR